MNEKRLLLCCGLSARFVAQGARLRGSLQLFVMLLFVLVNASVASSEEAATKITFAKDVLPIFQSACLNCHNQDKRKGGLALNTYALAMEGGSSGEVLVPGGADASRLFALITHREEPNMPPRGDRLDDTRLETVRNWIAGGLLENQSSKARLPDRPRFDFGSTEAPDQRPEGPPSVPRGVSVETLVRTKRTTAITALASSPWAPVVAVSGQTQVLLESPETGEVLGALPFPEGDVHVLRFSRNGSLLLAGGGRGGHSGRVVVWNVKTGERVLELGDELDVVLAADISGDHSQVALGGPGKMVRVYSTSTGTLVREIKKHTDWVTAIEFSPDSVLLASGDRSGGLHVWESLTGRHYSDLRGHGASVTDVSWRLDSNILASASEDATIRLWEMENGGEVKRWGAHGGVLSIDFSRDGRLATCGRDRISRIWQQDGKELRAFPALPDLALEVVLDHKGTRLVVADWTGEIVSWNSEDGKPVAHLSANPLTIAQSLAVAHASLDLVSKEYESLATQLAALVKTTQQATGRLEESRKMRDARRAGLTDAEARFATSREQATQSAKDLQAALEKLASAEDAHRVAAKSEPPDDATIQKAAAALAEVQKATTVLAAATQKAVDVRLALQTEVDGASVTVRKANADFVLIEEEARAATEAQQKHEAVVAPVSKRLDIARAALVRWTVADALEQTLKERTARQEALTRLTAEHEERQGAFASRLDDVRKTLEECATALDDMRTLSKEASQKIEAVTVTATEVVAAARQRTTGLGQPGHVGDEEIQATIDGIAAAGKVTTELAAVMDAGAETVAKARQAVDVSAKKATEALASLEGRRATFTIARDELLGHAKRVEEARQALESARAVVEERTVAFENARTALAEASAK